MYCQLVNICGCIPARIRHALAGLPETLDGTYERTLREINREDWEFAHRLLQFVAVAARPLRVEELAELLAFDFKEGSIPKFHEDWRVEDPMHAVLSTCRSFLTIVDISYSHRKVVQFSHFSVKEFLTSARLAGSNDIILRRYHISERPAHTIAAQACLGYLLHLDRDVTSYSLGKIPFAEYSAEYWDSHARVEDVSQNVKDGLKELFDSSKPHLAVCIWICDPSLPSWERTRRSERPSALRGTPLHYVVFWDLHSIVELLVNEHSHDVNSRDFTDSATPLHLASERGRLEVAHTLIECGASVSARNKDGQTPFYLASKAGRLEVARMLIERGADVSAQDKDGQSPMHLASQAGQLEVTRMLMESGADVSAQNKDGQTPLHLTLKAGRLEVARMLIERGADVSAQDKGGQTPLHLAAAKAGCLEVARMLIERGADVSAQDKDGQTPLHLALHAGRLEVARMLIERGADVSAQDKNGQTPVHLALEVGRLDVARFLIECGASVSARNRYGQTPLHLVSFGDWVPYVESGESSHPKVARMLIERGADVSAQDNDGQTPIHLAWEAGRLEVARVLIKGGTSVPSPRQGWNRIPLHMAYLENSDPIFGAFDYSEDAHMFTEPGADFSAQKMTRGGRRRGREEDEDAEEDARRRTRTRV